MDGTVCFEHGQSIHVHLETTTDDMDRFCLIIKIGIHRTSSNARVRDPLMKGNRRRWNASWGSTTSQGESVDIAARSSWRSQKASSAFTRVTGLSACLFRRRDDVTSLGVIRKENTALHTKYDDVARWRIGRDVRVYGG